MRIMEPVLPREMETAIPLEEALAMAAAYESRKEENRDSITLSFNMKTPKEMRVSAAA